MRLLRPLSFFPFLFSIFLLVSCGKKDVPEQPESSESEHLIYATVEAASGLRFRKTPSLEGEKLGLIPDHTKVAVLEITKERLTIGGEEGNWTRIRWNGIEGWVFGAFLQFENEPEDEGEIEGQGEEFASPRSIEKSAFPSDRGSFSLGLGCTGRTYSEYESILELDNGAITITYDHLVEYGNPGSSCAVTEQRMTEGEYSIDKGMLNVHLEKETTIELTGVLPECIEKTEKKTETKVDISRKYQMVLCDGKKALQELNPPEGLENMYYLDMAAMIE